MYCKQNWFLCHAFFFCTPWLCLKIKCICSKLFLPFACLVCHELCVHTKLEFIWIQILWMPRSPRSISAAFGYKTANGVASCWKQTHTQHYSNKSSFIFFHPIWHLHPHMLLAIVETQKRCHLPPGDVAVASNSACLQAGSKSVELSPALRWKGHWRPMVFPFFFGNVKHHVTLVSSGHFRATYKWKRKKSGGGSSPPPLTPQKKTLGDDS